MASNGLEAVELFREFRPDVVLMDLRMPKMDGLAATRAICAEHPGARVVVLTSFDGEEENSIRAGAKAIVLKDAPRQELIDTIRAVHSANADKDQTKHSTVG
jgi:DNA-binding NarL/FixJ family response regulator